MDSPWTASHPQFKESLISIHRAPEFSTGEVVLSSLYRASGFDGVPEKQVRSLGDVLSKLADKAKPSMAKDGKIQPDTWRTVLDRLTQSPKVSKQSSKRFLSLSPLVPDAALYSGAARLTGNPWNPGELVKRIVQLGSPSDDAAALAWARLHEALGIADDDDVWARWLQEEFESRRPSGVQWQASYLKPLGFFPSTDRNYFQYPARQFVADLEGVIAAKSAMTRRQWVSLLEAVLRIGMVSHVLWICDTTDRLWKVVRDAIESDAFRVPGRPEVASQVLSVRKRMLSFGHPAIPMLRDYASKYLSARLGLNSAMWALQEARVDVPVLDSVDGIQAFIGMVRNRREQLRSAAVLGAYRRPPALSSGTV